MPIYILQPTYAYPLKHSNYFFAGGCSGIRTHAERIACLQLTFIAMKAHAVNSINVLYIVGIHDVEKDL